MPELRRTAVRRAVWHLGVSASDADEAALVVAGFQRVVGPAAALVAPFDSALTTDPGARALGDTLWGWIATAEAECRWRVEGASALVSVVADRDLDGLALQCDEGEAVAGPEVRFEPAARAALGGLTARVIVYRKDGWDWLTRLEVSL